MNLCVSVDSQMQLEKMGKNLKNLGLNYIIIHVLDNQTKAPNTAIILASTVYSCLYVWKEKK